MTIKLQLQYNSRQYTKEDQIRTTWVNRDPLTYQYGIISRGLIAPTRTSNGAAAAPGPADVLLDQRHPGKRSLVQGPWFFRTSPVNMEPAEVGDQDFGAEKRGVGRSIHENPLKTVISLPKV